MAAIELCQEQHQKSDNDWDARATEARKRHQDRMETFVESGTREGSVKKNTAQEKEDDTRRPAKTGGSYEAPEQ